MHKHTAIAYQFTPSLHLGERSGNSTSATAQQQRANRREREQNGKKSTLNKWTDPQSFSSSVHRHVFVEMVDIFFPQHSPASYLLTAFCALHWNVVIVAFFSPWFFVGWICSSFFRCWFFKCTAAQCTRTRVCVCVHFVLAENMCFISCWFACSSCAPRSYSCSRSAAALPSMRTISAVRQCGKFCRIQMHHRTIIKKKIERMRCNFVCVCVANRK